MRKKGRTGGNVEQLKNGNFLVCTGTDNSIFEVTKDKKIVWKAEIAPIEKPINDYTYRLYRAHYLSSLYPCYFTFQTDEDTISKKSGRIGLKVFNEGSEKDDYEVKVLSATGEVAEEFTTGTLDAGGAQTFEIKPHKKFLKGHQIEVSVSSKTNTDLVRKSTIIVED